MPDLDLVTEQYWVLDNYIDVLATTTQAVREWDPWTPSHVARHLDSQGHGTDLCVHPSHRSKY
jgi:hypothetical protein